MKKGYWLVAAASAVLPLAACGLSSPEMVPLSVKSAKGTHSFQMEIARTEAEQKRGLQFRETLAPDSGMIFPTVPPREVSFWMKDTLIPLDMIFVRPDRTIARIETNAVPESLVPSYSGEAVIAVIEIAGGRAAQLGIEEGDTVIWRDPKS